MICFINGLTNSGFSNEGNFQNQEMSECCGAPVMEGMCSECGSNSMYEDDMGVNEFDAPAMDNFNDQYGDDNGEQVYYATANKQDRSPETFEKNESEIQITHGQKINALLTISRRILAAAVGKKSTHGQQEHDFADNVGLAAVKKKKKRTKKYTRTTNAPFRGHF